MLEITKAPRLTLWCEASPGKTLAPNRLRLEDKLVKDPATHGWCGKCRERVPPERLPLQQ